MMYRVLGQLSLGHDGELTLPTGRQLAVLAILLMNPNRRVATKELLRRVWGSSEVRDIQLHKRVSQIRAMLGQVGRRDDVVTHTGFGYELRATPDDHDLLAFQRLLVEADAPKSRDSAREAELLREALRLWRGQRPLAGVPGGFVEALGADLRYRHKRAMVRLCDIEFARGRHAEVLDGLRTMVDHHRTDGRLCGQLMLALFRNGHVMEALSVYEQHAVALDEESAAAPDATLRSLKFAIAAGREENIAQFESPGPQRDETVPRPVVVPRQLPPDLPSLIGRDTCVDEARWLLSRDRRMAPPVVVVTGPGGIGKTALATHVAHLVRDEYPDGQIYLDLGGTTPGPVDPTEAMAQVHRALGVVKVPDGRDERTSLYRTLLGDKRILLVLDDARDEAQIRDLIPGNPACGVLVTTRRRLSGLGGAHHLPTLRPLNSDEAVELFERIVRAVGVDPGAEPRATRQLVDLAAGLPLAIWVTAALRGQDEALGADSLLDRLTEQRLDALVYGDRSVARSIGAGLDQLDPATRQLFFGLGLLQLHDFTVWTAAAVLEDTPGDPYESLLRLARCHLLQPTEEGRYRFHELTREYANRRGRRHFADDGIRTRVLARVYGALLTAARRAHHGIYDGDDEIVHADLPDRELPASVRGRVDRAPLAWFEAERRNLRAAVRHSADLGLTGLGWDLAISAHEFYNLRGYLDDWRETHTYALAACHRHGDRRGEAAMLAILGQPALVASRRPGVSGIEELTRAVALFEACADPHGEAIARRTLGNALRRRGAFGAALEAFTAAQRLYEGCGDTVGRWQALRYIGQTRLDLGEYEQARLVLGEAAQVVRHAGVPRLCAQTAYWLGRAYLAGGDLDQAREQFQWVLATVGDADVIGRAYAYHGLGDVAELEDPAAAEARRAFDAALELARQGGDAVLEGRVHQSMARLDLSAGRRDDAADAYARAVVCFRGVGARHLAEEVATAQAELV